MAPIAGLAMAISVGLGFAQQADAGTSALTASPAVTRSGAQPEFAHLDRTPSASLGGGGSSVSALAKKLGEKEETVADALMAVRKREQSAAMWAKAPASANAGSSRGARQAAVARSLAAELGIDTDKVSASLTELQAARKAAGRPTSRCGESAGFVWRTTKWHNAGEGRGQAIERVVGE